MKHLSFNCDLGKPETVVVLGVGRGGTSLAAGTLRCLGVCMGADPHPVKHEWSPVVYRNEQVELAATLQNVEAMNREHALWGWKSPGDIFSLDQILPLLRRPALLIVTRDLVEATLSGGSYTDVPWEIGFYQNATVYQLIADRLRFCPCPAIAISFAEMRARPGELVELLCSFLQIAPTAEQRQKAVDFCVPGQNTYRSLDKNLPVLISEHDLEKDAQEIASGSIPRYTRQYLHHFRGMREQTSLAIEMLTAHLSRQPRREVIAHLHDAVQQLRVRWSADLPAPAAEPRAVGAESTASVACTINALDDLVRETGAAAENVGDSLLRTSFGPNEGYRILRQLHRLLLLLIALRMEVQKGLQCFAPSIASEAQPRDNA